MSVSWGSAQCDATNCFRVGIDYTQSPSSVSTNTPDVDVTMYVYLGTQYNAFDSSVTITGSGSHGSWSATNDFTHNSGTSWSSSNVTLVATRMINFNLTYGSSQAKSSSASITGLVAIAGTASHTRGFTIPARPYATPAAPSGVTATRVSDSQSTIAWTRNATTAAPYANIYVERYDYATSVWTQIAKLAGTATSYSATGQAANKQYNYRVRAQNSSAYSGYGQIASAIRTTPAVSTGVTAAKDASNNIVVDWVDNATYNTDFQVWHWTNGVRDGAALATVPEVSGPGTYTHPTPNATQTHAYDIVTRTTVYANGTGATLSSAASTPSSTVQLAAPPNAPTNLQPPPPSALDATQAIVLTWTHNPTDTSPQRKYEVQYRVNGGAWVSLGITTNAVSSRSVAGGTWTNGNTIEWQSRTWGTATTGGADGTGASAWSATASFLTSTPPTTTITTPANGATITGSTLTMVWTYSDAQGHPQAAYEAKLYDGTTLLETKTGTTGLTTTFDTPVPDGSSRKVGIRVQDSTGLWSTEVQRTNSVLYAKPAVPTFTLDWDETSGAVGVTITNPAPGAGEVATVSNTLLRSTDGGVTWKVAAHNIAANGAGSDPIPPLNKLVTYKVVAYSATPSLRESATADVPTLGYRWIFVNAGQDFGEYVRLHGGAKVAIRPVTERERRQFSGRTKPVEFKGESSYMDIGISTSLWRGNAMGESSWADILNVSGNAAPACYRDPDGNRYFVSMDDPDTELGEDAQHPLTWHMVEDDWTEPAV